MQVHPREDANTTSPVPTVVVAAIAAAIAVVDLFTPVGFNLAIAYLFPVVLTAWTRSVRIIWSVTVAVALLTFLDVVVGAPSAVSLPGSSVWINRGFLAAAFLAAAAVVHLWVRARGSLEASRSELQEQNDELAQREEEIARQNEELQSQTEELERQSEELRLTNEELSRRERALQSLLDLSRSLTAGLTQSETLNRICTALSQLVNHDASAAAIVERRANRLFVRCDYGFEHGLEQPTWDYERSFARIVIERNQAAYVEDASLRPDLLMPRRKDAPPFRSVLAAPLRVRGQAIGSVEVYSHEKTSWTDEHIALVESLAAQASISLESAELFDEIDRQRRRFETVFRTLPIGVMVADAAFTDSRINPAGAAMFTVATDVNLAAPDFVRTWNVHRAGQVLPLEQYPIRLAARGQIVQNEELEIVFNAGRRAVLLTSANPIRDRDGNVTGAVCAFTDITAQKELQREIDARRREAEEASVRKTRFLAAVSHDIRTPANAINLLAELIRRTAENPAMLPQVPQLAAELQASAVHLIDLVSDVLDVARFDTGRIDVQESEFPLTELLAEEVRQLMPLARDKNVAMEVDEPAAPIHVRTDRIKLGRCLANLVHNAIKFTHAGGRIRVAAAHADGAVHVTVTDTGVGIAPEHLPLIFDEFYQLRNPERDRHKGTGLGLAICKRLAEAMGGSVAARSAPGQGSTFTITLPPAAVVPARSSTTPGDEGARAAAAPAAPAAARAPLADRRILLIEDHDSTRSATANLLENHGATVFQAPDGETGLRVLEAERPDILLLDLMLPDIDGREIVRRIRANRPPHLSHLFILTGDHVNATEPDLIAMGADAVCFKPIDIACLVDALAAPRDKSASPPPSA